MEEEETANSGLPLLAGRFDLSRFAGIRLRSDFGEYDDKWQLLRIECISETDTRRLLGVLESVISASVFTVVVMVAVGVSQWSTTAMQTVNALVASVLVGCTTACIVWMAESVIAARRSGKHWSDRRRRMLVLYCVQLAAMAGGMLAYLGINLYGLLGLCHRLTPIVIFGMSTLRWTCWNVQFLLFLVHADNCTILPNSGRKDSMVLDLPLTHHGPKLLLAAAFQALALLEAAWLTAKHIFLALTIGLVLLACVYYALFIATTVRASRLLHRRPWTEYRLANTIFRLQIRLALYSYTLVFATMLLFWFVDLGSCSQYSFQWFGLPPAQVVWCVVTIICCLLFAPKDPGEQQPILIAQLHEFAWTEASLPQKLQERNERVGGALDKEPMFCFETAVKLFLWCCLVYDYLEDDPGMLTPFRMSDATQLGKAMAMWGLRCSKLLFDERTAIKALFAWSGDTILIAFRGSVTMANLVADAQLWQTVHYLSRRPGLVAARRSAVPMVHSGFSSCWYSNGMNKRVLAMVNMLLKNTRHSDVKVLCTGHSLGGALAQLASFDIARTFGLSPDQVTCYTFGAPRTGNAAFAAEAEREVPATWHIINDQDVIPRGAKFVNLYKRAGHKVIITGRGDLVVRPTPIESSMLQAPFGSSLAHHALNAYQSALMSICISQLDDTRRLPGGFQGLSDLVRSCPVFVQDMHRYVTNDWRSALMQIGSRLWDKADESGRPQPRTRAAAGSRSQRRRRPTSPAVYTPPGGFGRSLSAPFEGLSDEALSERPSTSEPTTSGSTRSNRPKRLRSNPQAFSAVELVERHSLPHDSPLETLLGSQSGAMQEMQPIEVETGGASLDALAQLEAGVLRPPPRAQRVTLLRNISLDTADSMDSVQSAPP